MKKLGIFYIILFIAYSCEDPMNECTECFSRKKNIESGAIESSKSLGTFCGQDIDSVESIRPVEMGDDYIYYNECQ